MKILFQKASTNFFFHLLSDIFDCCDYLASLVISVLVLAEGSQHERETPKGGDVVIDLDVTLEELYMGNFIEVGCRIY